MWDLFTIKQMNQSPHERVAQLLEQAKKAAQDGKMDEAERLTKQALEITQNRKSGSYY